jgi:SulP family sulfate permease
VLPDPAVAGRHFKAVAHEAPLCPQLDVLRIDGSLFFGAVEHVRDELEAARKERPDLRHVLIVGSAINFVDAAGAELLAEEARSLRAMGVTLYLCKLKPQVRDVLRRGGQLDTIGHENVFETKEQAIRTIYARLDAARCAVCTARVFNECHVALPDGTPREAARPDFDLASPGRR